MRVVVRLKGRLFSLCPVDGMVVDPAEPTVGRPATPSAEVYGRVIPNRVTQRRNELGHRSIGSPRRDTTLDPAALVPILGPQAHTNREDPSTDGPPSRIPGQTPQDEKLAAKIEGTG